MSTATTIMTATTPSPSIAAPTDIDALKARLKATWMDGNYDYFSRFMEQSAVEFADRLSECSAVTICNEHPSSCSGAVGHNHRICDGHIPGAAGGIGLNAIGMISPLSGRFNVRIADGDIAATPDAYTFPCIDPDMVEGERAGAADDRIAVG
jgi:hypothetical protein